MVLVAWRGGLFLIDGKIRVLSVSYLSLTLCVFMYTHTYTLQMGYSVVSPGVGMRHLEGPENPDRPNLGVYIFVYLYKVHICMYMLGGGMRSWTDCFFL